MKLIKNNSKQVNNIQRFEKINAVSAVRAIALMKGGDKCGKIILHYSNNPAGSVCTAYIYLNGYSGIDKAGGYGYDKASQAIYHALKQMTCINWDLSREISNCDNWLYTLVDMTDDLPVEPGAGNQREVFVKAGYTWIEIM